jgi:hypothetical protein
MKELELRIEELEERIAPCALSMINAVGVGAKGGMDWAMTVNNPNGNTGMGIAVANSSGLGANCPG